MININQHNTLACLHGGHNTFACLHGQHNALACLLDQHNTLACLHVYMVNIPYSAKLLWGKYDEFDKWRAIHQNCPFSVNASPMKPTIILSDFCSSKVCVYHLCHVLYSNTLAW